MKSSKEGPQGEKDRAVAGSRATGDKSDYACGAVKEVWQYCALTFMHTYTLTVGYVTGDQINTRCPFFI